MELTDIPGNVGGKLERGWLLQPPRWLLQNEGRGSSGGATVGVDRIMPSSDRPRDSGAPPPPPPPPAEGGWVAGHPPVPPTHPNPGSHEHRERQEQAWHEQQQPPPPPVRTFAALRDRVCTDLLGWILLVLLTVWIGIVFYKTFADGDVAPLWRGADSWGNVCGVDNSGHPDAGRVANTGLDLRGRDFLFYFDPVEGAATHPSPGGAARICVTACPTAAGGAAAAAASGLCLHAPYSWTAAELVASGLETATSGPGGGGTPAGCPPWFPVSFPLARRCQPVGQRAVVGGWGVELLDDLQQTWGTLIVAGAGTVCVGTAIVALLLCSANGFSLLAAAVSPISLFVVGAFAVIEYTGPETSSEQGTDAGGAGRSDRAEHTNKAAALYTTLAFVLGAVAAAVAVGFVRALDQIRPFLLEASDLLARNPGLVVLAGFTATATGGVIATAVAATLWFYGGKEPVRVYQFPARYEWQFDDVIVAYAFPWTPVLAVLWSYCLLRAGQSIAVATVAADDLNRLRPAEHHGRAGCCRTLGGVAALVGFHLGTASITALFDLLLAPLRAVLVVAVGDEGRQPRHCRGCSGLARAVMYSGRLGGISTGTVGTPMAKLHWANILKLLQQTPAATGPVMLYNGLVAALLKGLVVVIHSIVLLFYFREHHTGLRYYMIVLLASTVPTYLVASAAIGVIVNLTDAIAALFGLELCLSQRPADVRIGKHLRGLLPAADHGGGYDDRDAIRLEPLGSPLPADPVDWPGPEHTEWVPAPHRSNQTAGPVHGYVHDQPALQPHSAAGTAGRGRDRFAWAPRPGLSPGNQTHGERGRVQRASSRGRHRPNGPAQIRLAEHPIDGSAPEPEPLPPIRAAPAPGAVDPAARPGWALAALEANVDRGGGDSDTEGSDVDADTLYREDRLDGFAGMDGDHLDGRSEAAPEVLLPGMVTAPSPSPPPASPSGEQGLCVICMTERANQVLSPCKHLCLCRGCLVELRSHGAIDAQLNQARPGEPVVLCPMCRTAVTGTLSIYLS